MAREPNENKEKALQAALSQIERQFGKGSMMRLGDREQIDIPSISTGSWAWISRLESEGCRAAGSSRSMDRIVG